MAAVVDIFVLYRIIKDLSTPFEKMDSFKAGVIDAKGKRIPLKRDSKGVELKLTKDQKKSDNFYWRFIRNIKRLLGKVGLGGKLATFAGALLLLKESQQGSHLLTESGDRFVDEDSVLAELVTIMNDLRKNSNKNFKDLKEEIANVTGPAVVGTGDDQAGMTFAKIPYRVGVPGDRKRKGRYINGVAFLKKVAREAIKKQSK